MNKYTDILLYQTHQHYMIYVSRFLRGFLPYALIVFLVGNYVYPDTFLIYYILWIIAGGVVLYLYENHLRKNSYILITNEKLAKKVRRGFFKKNKMTINYDSIRDVEMQKKNILHFFSGCGTLYARSSSGSQSDFEASWTPDIENIYRKVNFLNNLDEDQRQDIKSPADLEKALDLMIKEKQDEMLTEGDISFDSLVDIITHEAKGLKDMDGVHEIILLNDSDRLFIFEKEEQKNHAVHEVLNKKIVYAILYDEAFSLPNQVEVIKVGEKEVFPSLTFDKLNIDGVIAGYPGIDTQAYLLDRFKKNTSINKVLLIGFDA